MSAGVRIAFRADASAEIGLGHAMRCLTLADLLRKSGARTRFVCRSLPDYLQRKLTQHGHELILLVASAGNYRADELAHSGFLKTSQQVDAQQTREALADQNWDWLVVDHYGIDHRYETALRDTVRRVMAIDDIGDRQHDCELLLDQNLYADMKQRYDGKTPAACKLLLGPEFALLREEFLRLRQQVESPATEIRHALVSLGGFDPCNLTQVAVTALHRVFGKSLKLDVIIGNEHPSRVEIERICRMHDYRCHLHTERMAEFMAAADIAIGAGGSTSWERCCLGLAAITVAFADNQKDIAASLEQAGACIFLGDQHTATQAAFEKTLQSLLVDRERLSMLSSTAYSLVDGRGAQRVRDHLFSML